MNGNQVIPQGSQCREFHGALVAREGVLIGIFVPGSIRVLGIFSIVPLGRSFRMIEVLLAFITGLLVGSTRRR